MNVQITTLDIIHQCYCDGHQFRLLLTILIQYKDNFFKSLLQRLIDGKMVDIVRIANENRTCCEG
jgi:hypothetical protein